MMKRIGLVVAGIAFAVLMHSAVARAQAPPGPIAPVQQEQPAPGTPEAREAQASPRITEYTLPPELYKKTERLSKIRLGFLIGGTIYGLIVLWLILRMKVAPKYRDWAESVSRNLLVQVLVFVPLLVLTIDVLTLPQNIYAHIVSRDYGLSVQGWGSWIWDWTKSELVGVVGGIIVIAILYWVIRKSPRLWWFYFWLASLPLAAALVFLQPLVIDPLFHEFEPLAEKNPVLTASLEQMVQRAGEHIPTERMYLMGEAVKGTDLNAYVTGYGASKRMVIYDTTVAKMTTPEIVVVMGHETGHYVLNHIPKGLAIGAIGLFVTFYLGYRLIGWMLGRWGTVREIRDVGDLASLPALLLLLSVISFVGSPIANSISRYFEHQADQYAMEVTHGLIPDNGQVAAQGFLVLGETDLEYPDPSPLNVLMTYDHPAARDRVQFFLHYDPWASGGTGEFVH
jgi:STE24 endopeptidase